MLGSRMVLHYLPQCINRLCVVRCCVLQGSTVHLWVSKTLPHFLAHVFQSPWWINCPHYRRLGQCQTLTLYVWIDLVWGAHVLETSFLHQVFSCAHCRTCQRRRECQFSHFERSCPEGKERVLWDCDLFMLWCVSVLPPPLVALSLVSFAARTWWKEAYLMSRMSLPASSKVLLKDYCASWHQHFLENDSREICAVDALWIHPWNFCLVFLFLDFVSQLSWPVTFFLPLWWFRYLLAWFVWTWLLLINTYLESSWYWLLCWSWFATFCTLSAHFENIV